MNSVLSLSHDVGKKPACEALRVPRATFYRHQNANNKHKMKFMSFSGLLMNICAPYHFHNHHAQSNSERIEKMIPHIPIHHFDQELKFLYVLMPKDLI